jgi:hypothetical protein
MTSTVRPGGGRDKPRRESRTPTAERRAGPRKPTEHADVRRWARVLDTVKGADLGLGPKRREVVVDVGVAYDPSCAYDPAWACPLAPPGDATDASVPVGERLA